jgi:predicted dehydrogenase
MQIQEETMSQKIRVGVVGTSWWADFMYLPALQSHPQAEITAICARNRGRVEEMAGKYHIPKVFTNYDEMIREGGLDAIVVGVPDDLHYDVTMQGLRAGLHVLCDKPLAVTTQQAREMYEEAEKADVRHMVLFTYRWMPFFQYFHDLIGQGYIGRCYHCEFQVLMGYGRNGEYIWRQDRDRSNGVLGDLGAHMIDMARWLIGDVSRISAQLGVFVERPGEKGGKINPANDSALMLVEFENGTHGIIQASSVAHLADRGMQQLVKLYGDAGSLEINIPYLGAEAGAVIYAARSQDEQFQKLDVPMSYWGDVNPSEPFNIFTQQSTGCREFIDAILTNRPSIPTFYDGYKAQQVIEAAMSSHISRKWVTIATG